MNFLRFNVNPVYLPQPLFNACFYGLRNIFVLYIIVHLSLSRSDAIAIYSSFMALCYATTLLGGYMADHGMGAKNGAITGGTLMVSGLLCALLPNKDLCLLGLALASLGSGLFKPNLLAAIGLTFEKPKDPRKDKTYSTVYILGNAGIFGLTALCSFVGEWLGWHYGILLVAGMFTGATYLAWRKIQIHPTHQNKEPASRFFQSKINLVGAIASITGLLYLLLKYPWPFHGMMAAIMCGSLVYFTTIFWQCTTSERKGLLTVAAYIFLFALFVTLFEQSGSSLTLFLEHAVDREVLGITFPPPAIMSLGTIFVFTCGPLLIFLSSRYLEKAKPLGKPLGEFTKSGWCFLFVTLAFWLLALGAKWGAGQDGGSLIPITWIVGAIFMKTMGELLIAPISLSKVNQHSPAHLQSIMMSFWTMAIAYGHYFAGIIAQFSVAAKPEDSLDHYQSFFFYLGLAALLIGGAVLICQVIHSRIKASRRSF